jgi:O-succinylbenzoate synthase
VEKKTMLFGDHGVHPEQISYSTYTLKAKASLSARVVSQERRGALIRVETAHGIGYADVHPWEELGDLKLEDELHRLKTLPTHLGRRSLGLAALDAEARGRKLSAFANLKIPHSHYLINDTEQISELFLEKIWQQGFRCLKFKVGRNLKAEIEKLTLYEKQLSAFRLRLDFNSQLTLAAFLEFSSSISLPIQLSIEFIEDPMPLDVEQWQKAALSSDLSLALDHVTETELVTLQEVEDLPIKWLVIKPAVQNPRALAEWADERRLRFCVTSYLDHPVGQMGAALEAARLWQEFPIAECGLTSHLSYEKNEFSESLQSDGPLLSAPQGTGIGFDDILARIDWKKL